MAKKSAGKSLTPSLSRRTGEGGRRPGEGRPSSLLDTRVIYYGDNLEQLSKLPDACIDLIYIDPPFNSNRNYNLLFEAPSGHGVSGH